MIKVQNLSKYYSSKRALGPVSFEIQDRETVGFLGLNGAGKTTALRILACDLRPSSGSVTIGKLDALSDPHEVRKRIGFLPETTPLYHDMRVDDYVMFAARIRGMTKAAARKRLPAVLGVTNLGEVAHDPISSLSHGFRQRVGVAGAIVHEPEFLILDEPTRGLDPVQVVDMRNMIQALKDAHTVLISSHILTEISQTCDRLLILGQGEIIASGTEASLSSDLIDTKRVEVIVRLEGEATLDELKATLEAIDGVSAITQTDSVGATHMVEMACSAECRPAIARAVVEAGYQLEKLDESRSMLESTFLRLVKGGTGDRN
ncbi:MAG TPA: ABC transporter ATP-binding protein [Kofleriaceae bacterium]|nr:ABC transporter ATP-binding protein [Kofleriaceae bacterium]